MGQAAQINQKIGVEVQTEGESTLCFGPFRLEAAKRLWRGTQLLELRPRPLAVLRYLAERSGQLVSKEELLKRLWPGIYVTKTVIKVCVREVRHALQDNPATPRVIETVGSQGYRFIAPLSSPPPANGRQLSVLSKHKGSNSSTDNRQPADRSQHLTTDIGQPAPPFVNRERELAFLHESFARVQRGERQITFISGEAGIGKTGLVDRFLNSLPTHGEVRIGRGQCIEQQAQGEAYLPILEALGQLCRKQGEEHILATLRRYAPTWLLQLPGLLEPDEREGVQRQVHGNGRERMLRELGDAIEQLTIETPLVLVLEDLHWSDVSTLELLSYLAQRRGQIRLHILCTYRPAEVVASGHSLRRIVQELHGHGQCEEMALELLTEEHVEEYVQRRLSGSLTLQALSHFIYSRTEGNPLFMVSFVDYLLQRELLVETDGQWELRADLTTLNGLIPESMQRLIARQIEGLSREEQRLLEVASVVGMTFTAAEVAGVTGQAVADVEERYESLATRQHIVEMQGITEWPDKTLVARYSFRHALYRDFAYRRIGQAQQVRLHRQLGEWLEAIYGKRAGEIAGELAVHFEKGRDAQRAVRYRQQGGKTASRRNAHREVKASFTRGLELLQTLPKTPERKQQELGLLSSTTRSHYTVSR